MARITRLSVPPLWQVTQQLAAVAAGRAPADLVITDARILSTYTDRISGPKEIWLSAGRIAAVKPLGAHRAGPAPKSVYSAQGGILAPGLCDPHIHIESSMVTACAYAEAALLNGTTTIFCDSHEIGNVMDVAGVEAMLEDARLAPLSIFLTVPSTVPATSPELETAGGDLTPAKIGALFDRWPEAVALGEKMDFVPVVMGDPRSHGIIAEALKRGRPVSGHIYGREFVAPYAASGVTDTHEAVDRDIADDFADAGIWVFLRGGNPATPWNSIEQALGAVKDYGASHKRFCICTDDRDADDLMTFGLDWVAREAVRLGMTREQAWAMGSLHGATRFGMDGEIGGLGGGRRADIVLLDDDLRVQNTWYGGTLMVEGAKITSALEQTLSDRYRYPDRAYDTAFFASADTGLRNLLQLGLLACVVAAAIVAVKLLQKSPFGRLLRAIRDNEPAVTAIGKDPAGYKIRVFMVGAALAGIAGAFYAHFITFITPEQFISLVTFYVWMSIILGGVGSMRGALLGTLVLVFFLEGSRFLRDLMPSIGEAQMAHIRLGVIGLALILCMLYRPQGFFGKRGT